MTLFYQIRKWVLTTPLPFGRLCIRGLNGNQKLKTPYLRDSHNNKLHTLHDEERFFREHWTHFFSNDDLEDNDFHYDHIQAIEQTVTITTLTK